ncbi:MAG: DUF4038 domain-containing protein [Balneolaceae bacterium]|nr:MAG: DUF4038 domain-containing protein [Balneolaceae bacterium]
MLYKNKYTIIVLLIFFCIPACLAGQSLRLSENKRFLVESDGEPFFWLGDTAWELFHRLDREMARYYLQNRADLGFTVIQAVVLAEENGLNDPNPYGEVPLFHHDPAQPNEAYFEHVDYIITLAYELGMYVAVLPTWGDKWNLKWGQGPEMFTPENARIFGEFLGNRYRDYPNIIWVVGGDRPIEEPVHREIVIAMAEGLRNGDGGTHLISFHPMGGEGSAEYFHNEEWLDFNMRQTGHTKAFTDRYEVVRSDYKREPIKPVIDSEPIYEDHPIDFRREERGHSISADVRRPLYWNLFGGGFGHTYGHHSVWQMWEPGRRAVNHPLMPWYEAIYQPGAAQMQYGRRLMESRPFLTRIPDDTILVPHPVASSVVPGAGEYRYTATRDTDGTYAMVYVPVGRDFEIRMDMITGSEIIAWWYNPRNGETERIGTFPNTGTQRFTPPAPGENLDWILVLDDASANYPPPGEVYNP